MNDNSEVTPRRALITGASAGIGAAFAARLARDGYNLVLVARRRAQLEAVAARLRTENGATVEVLDADLAQEAGMRAVEAYITGGDPLDLLVNNAGFAVYGPIAESDSAVMTEMIQLNVIALTRLTHAALPAMLARNSGAIINVSSGLSFGLAPTRGAYSGTKAYVNNFTRILHMEVAERGVRVQLLVPGITRTDFHTRSGTDLARVPATAIMEPEALVDASLIGLERGEIVCIPGLTDPDLLVQFEAAQSAVGQNLIRNGQQPAARYGLAATGAID